MIKKINIDLYGPVTFKITLALETADKILLN